MHLYVESKVGRCTQAIWCPLTRLPGCCENRVLHVSYIRLNYPFASWVPTLLVSSVNNDCPRFGEVSALGLWCGCFKFSHHKTFKVGWVTSCWSCVENEVALYTFPFTIWDSQALEVALVISLALWHIFCFSSWWDLNKFRPCKVKDLKFII